MGAESKYDLILAPSHDIEKLDTFHAMALQNLSQCNISTINNMTQKKMLSLDEKTAISSPTESFLKNRKSNSTPVLTRDEVDSSIPTQIGNACKINEQDTASVITTASADNFHFNYSAGATENDDERRSNASIDFVSAQTNLEFNLSDPMNHNQATSSFKAYFSPTSHSLLEQKKILRHHSLQDNNKSQSTTNLLSFDQNMQLTVSEPNALNQLTNSATDSEIKSDLNVANHGPPTSASSSYFPLEPTMEECLETLDISYDTTNNITIATTIAPHVSLPQPPSLVNSGGANSTDNKILYLSDENEDDHLNRSKSVDVANTSGTDFLGDESDLFANLLAKDSNEIEMFLSTLNSFAQRKSKLIELLKSLSVIKPSNLQQEDENGVNCDLDELLMASIQKSSSNLNPDHGSGNSSKEHDDDELLDDLNNSELKIKNDSLRDASTSQSYLEILNENSEEMSRINNKVWVTLLSQISDSSTVSSNEIKESIQQLNVAHNNNIKIVTSNAAKPVSEMGKSTDDEQASQLRSNNFIFQYLKLISNYLDNQGQNDFDCKI